MHRILEVCRWVIFILWFSISGYMGLAGYVSLKLKDLYIEAETAEGKPVELYDAENDTFISLKSEKSAKAVSEEIQARKLFRFILDWPDALTFFLAATSFGALGGVTSLTKKMVIEKRKITELNIFTEPLLGALTGILVLGLSNLIPTLFIANKSELEPITVVFFSLLTGFLNKQFFSWLSDNFGKIFKQ